MKQISGKFIVAILVLGYLLTACSGTRPDVKGGDNSGNGNNSSQSQSTEVHSSQDGTPEAQQQVDLNSQLTPSESGTPGPDVSETPGPDSTEVHSGDNNPNEFVGAVESINGDQWTINGQTFTVTNATEIKGTINVGDLVKLEVTVNPDGTVTVREISLAPAGATPGVDDNSSSSGTPEATDDHGGSTSGSSSSQSGGTSSGGNNSSSGGSGGGHDDGGSHSSGG